MSKILIIAEKPSVARDIAGVLKCNKRGDGYLFSDTHIVSWAVGHLVTLFDPEDYSENLKKWNYNTLPIIPEEIKLKPVAQTKKQFDILKKLMKDKEVDSFICATDSGREGELIFRYIYDLAKSKKPFKRLWISSMTDQAITEGFQNLKDSSAYDNLYNCAKCRSEADWLVGINATRAFTLRYNALLSIGRVQTPTLAIIVERQKEINAFIPEDFYEVTALFDGYKGKWFDPETNETKILKEELATQIKDKVIQKDGEVLSIETEEKRQVPPFLYDLTELQRDCNRKYGFSATKTLEIAQSLYEKRKMITYPRTDSRFLSDDMTGKVKTALLKLSNIEKYKELASYTLNLNPLPLTKRIVDNSKVTDHHAIIPTDSNLNINNLSHEEFCVFDLVAKRFIAVFYPPYLYNITKIVTQTENENFLTKGTTIVDLGYMKIYKDDESEAKTKAKKKKDDEEEIILPNVSIGDKIKTTDAISERKKTSPPKTYNEATLLSAMENPGRFIEDEDLKEQLKESGLGTPATRASIIERLIQVGYIVRKGKAVLPTDKGMKLIEVVPNELKSPETTGKWEKGLSSISKGTMEASRFMASINRYVTFLIGQSKTSNSDVIFEQENRYKGPSKYKAVGKCPVCQNGEILENTKSFFCTNWKNGCKFSLWKNSVENYSVTITTDIAKKLLKNNKVEKINLTLPQTKEKCTATLTFIENGLGKVQFLNVDRIKEDRVKEDTINVDTVKDEIENPTQS